MSAKELEIKTENLQGTEKLARIIAGMVRPEDVITLKGELGTGKTTFARKFIRELNNKDEEVPSPTFNLVQTYKTPAFDIWHFDLYRLEDAEDVFELGMEDALSDGVSLIEWPEILSAILPISRLQISIDFLSDAKSEKRKFTLQAAGKWSQCLNKIEKEYKTA